MSNSTSTYDQHRMIHKSEGVLIRLETLIEINFFDSSFSSSNSSIRAFRACPLIVIKQTVPCRAIRGNSVAVDSTLPPLKDASRI